MTATLRDVARLAGVSTSTASNVMRGATVVAPATRERVEAAARQLRYRPNGVARALRRRSSPIVGLLVPEPVNPFFAELALGVEAVARHGGMGVLIANTGCDPEVERRQVEALIDRRAAGVVVGGLVPGSDVAATLAEHGVRVVLAACGASADERVDVVDTDDERALDSVVEHLVGLGHRRLAFVRQPLPETMAERRAAGFAAAVHRAGATLVDVTDAPTAIAAHNDTLAIEELDRLARAGLSVPGDVSVVGFDDIPLAGHSRIALTTVRSGPGLVGERAAAVLLGRLADPSRPPHRELLPGRLVVRGSTGPARPTTEEAR